MSMSSRYTLSKQTFECLLKQLVDLEENKNKLLEEYVDERLGGRAELQNLFSNYIEQLDLVVQNTLITEDDSNLLPLVTISSDVEVLDLDTNITENFVIVTPFQNTTSNEASYLSPIGRALLLKKPGDHVTIKTPGGLINFEIKSISFANHMLNPPS